MSKSVEMDQLDPESGGSRFQVARASVQFGPQPVRESETTGGFSPDSNSNSHGRPSIYETKYLRSLRHYLTRDALPRETHYRNLGSIAEGRLRPTIDELRDENYVKDAGDAEADADQTELKGKVIKFGWIEGVYMRCLLNIWGVMLFLRLTWVVGEAGIVEALAIICAANIVTVITTISMSAVATNGQIKGGGIYYMISRSLGPEFGASIGLLFTVSNSVAVAMYVVGFCSSFSDMLREYAGEDAMIVDGGVNDARIIGSVAMVLILALAIVGMDWVTRVQLLLLFLLIASQVDFVVGCFMGPQDDTEKAQGFEGLSFDLLKENAWNDYRPFEGIDYNFFSVFGVFFPAVTGIVAGANLSGDLKDPAEAIPKGTLLAIFTTFCTYIVYPIMIAAAAQRYASGDIRELNVTDPNGEMSMDGSNDTLYPVYNCTGRIDDCDYGTQISSQVMGLISAWAPLIYAGCFAATLSSAIASLVGAPRVLQALAKDKLYPYIHFFAKGYGANQDPFRGYVIVFIVAECCVLIGQLNPIANLSSEVFLAAYALINLSCFHASLLKSPGWRPVFKYYNAWVSLLGAIICMVVMFLCDAIIGTVVLVITLLLYLFVSYRKLDVNWGSTTQAQTYVTALGFMQRLNQVRDHVKNYRPQVLVLSGMPGDRPPLVDFGNALTKNLSLLICGHVVKGPITPRAKSAIQNQANAWLQRHKVRAFYSVIEDESYEHGAVALMQLAGLGNLKPNMTLMGYKNDWRTCPRDEVQQYFSCVNEALDNYLAVAILRVKNGLDFSAEMGEDPTSPLHKSNTSTSLKGDGANGSDEGSDEPNDRSATSGDATPRVTTVDGKKKNGEELYVSRTGEPLPAQVVENLTQFRSKQKGFIDVWWLYDDGGLTLLLPYILTSRSQWADCKLRVFALANKRGELDTEKRSMAALLSKFRIDYSDVIVIDDVTKKAEQSTRDTFNEMIAPFKKDDESDIPDEISVTDSELLANKDKTNRHLRLHELVQQHSKDSSLVVMTLPMTRKGTVHAPLYMAWLEMMTKDMPPFLMIRGNQTSVLTFYS
ncbi:solute carrier family 12 member 3-like isoform X1 [Amphibalanus amphitrite]|uniref:solute carrier family 12 member 3-like isoform X1 n=1 Tax=Amphibalanus amphitrite TaxID=1232801 RepID=UPI001C9243B7|nr:solute carrier family 12 member 3-like isoform X1 [Amphibalanus amphitrite]